MIYHPLPKPTAERASPWPGNHFLSVIIESPVLDNRSGGQGLLSHERNTVLGQRSSERLGGLGYCGLLVFAVTWEVYRWAFFEIEGSTLDFSLAGNPSICVLQHTISIALEGGGDFRHSSWRHLVPIPEKNLWICGNGIILWDGVEDMVGGWWISIALIEGVWNDCELKKREHWLINEGLKDKIEWKAKTE